MVFVVGGVALGTICNKCIRLTKNCTCMNPRGFEEGYVMTEAPDLAEEHAQILRHQNSFKKHKNMLFNEDYTCCKCKEVQKSQVFYKSEANEYKCESCFHGETDF